LLEQSGEIVSREQLRERIWGDATFVEVDQGLNYCIRQIRIALRDGVSEPTYIETLPKQGYRFIADVVATPKLKEASPAAQNETAKTTLTDETSDSSNQSPPDTAIPSLALIAQRSFIWLTAACACGVLVVLGITFVLSRSGVKHLGQPAIKSLAVLPLKNLSGDPTQEYLADGMTEELIGRLAGIRDLRVISRTSVMRFKDTKLSAPEIAKTLVADALVEGSVIREGDRIRVHAQLIRGASDEHFWSETYDRQMGDVIALQSDVAQSIAEKVQVTVSGQEQSRLVAASHVSPEVYESYLKGQFAAHNTRAELEQSIVYFEDAIRKDPTFAPAYVGLASTYQTLSLILVGASPAEMRPKEIRAAQKALELDPELAEAHVLMADVYQKRWRWSDAEAEYKEALRLKPSDAAAHLGFASWLLCHGRTEEALAWARRARELNPFGTTGLDIGWILFHARRYDEAIREFRSVLAVHPDSASGHWYLGFALIGKGHPEEAIAELERTASMMNRSPGSLELLATAYGYSGRRTEALRLISELKQRRQESYVPAGAFINPYLALRDYNEAFAWFERAYAEQSNILQFLKVHPFFDPVRGDPRFQDLVRRVGLR
jgi:TolB-like protein/tetratricopeptide (TPR) repeat protein/DNA-binding winged helix-turn-helix (wHTH) protein